MVTDRAAAGASAGPSAGSRWRRRWFAASVGAAAVATVADALLLQRARSYFTGGFLAADSLRSLPEAAAFIAGSLIADVGVMGLVAALVLWLAARARVVPRVAIALATVVALAPVAAADFAQYEIASYLGDAFDLGLMFDLAGRDLGEVWAVASEHIVPLAAAGLVAVAVIAILIVVLRRHVFVAATDAGLPPALGLLAWPVVLLMLAAGCTTAIRRSSDVLDNGLRRKPTGQWLGAVTNQLSDVDGDGYGILGRPPDPELFDSRVRPYAVDQPGNGVDEDGLAGDLPTGLPAYREPPSAAPTFVRRPDVVLFVLESFRADAVGARVGNRPVTPVIDALSAAGVAARQAYSHNGYTVQARFHIFSGSVADLRDQTSLIDDFKANGYETAYFSGQDESFGGAAYGVGFERADVSYDARQDRDKRYSTFSTAGSLAVPASLLVERVTSLLESRAATKPLFLYVNFHDTHFPYHHPGIAPLVNDTPLPQRAITPDRRADLRATYLNTAANVDRAIGQVLDVARRTLGHDPGVIVTADHGESLFDEGFLGHGYALNEVQTRVPLVVAGLPITLKEPVAQADLRDAIRLALTRPDGQAAPRIERDPSREVFQYLGTFDRPAAIALTSATSRLEFDMRERKMRVGGGAWTAPSLVGGADADRWRTLVTTWERMIAARHAALTRR